MTLTTKLTREMTGLARAAALGLSMGFAAVALPAMAQESGAEAPGIAYNDAVLNNFVSAAMEVTEVREEYAPRVQAAESEAEAKQIAEAAVLDMRAAVEDVDGIDVETYMAIGQAAQTDEDLAARITAIVQEREGNAPADQG